MAHPLSAVLRQVEPDSCPSRHNFHCHTIHSDGSLSAEALAEQALAIGLEHLAITDHHDHSAHAKVEALFAGWASAGRRVPCLWRGAEISCLLEGCLVHVLALGFADHHPSLLPYLQRSAVVGPALRSEAVLAAIQAAGGLALLAHPARYRLPHGQLLAAAAAQGFDGAEVWYDYSPKTQPWQPWQPTLPLCGGMAAEAADRGLLPSCGTDTHGLDLRGR